jgi:hypothetical protein
MHRVCFRLLFKFLLLFSLLISRGSREKEDDFEAHAILVNGWLFISLFFSAALVVRASEMLDSADRHLVLPGIVSAVPHGIHGIPGREGGPLKQN